MKVLVLNSGSSSQKSSLYELGDAIPSDPLKPLWEAKIEWSGESAEMEVRARGEAKSEKKKVESRQEAVESLLSTLWSGQIPVIAKASDIDVVGHRVVHGGAKLQEPAIVNAEVKQSIAEAAEFAPLHNRAELEGIEIAEKSIPAAKQVCVFDTGFHRTIPLAFAVYPGPYEWLERGIRRYGFHGINHQYCAQRASRLLGRDKSSLRLITCHLGNGCSLAAIRDGRSIDTTMGFTPLEGLMMGTRSGSVDAGILTYLMRQAESGGAPITGEQFDDILNHDSGLKGVSGISEDMREILKAMNAGNDRAKLAFDIYVHRLQRGIGEMAAVLGGVDALIFTAGVGEHSPEVRGAVCANLAFLGIMLDDAKNAASPDDEIISKQKSPAKVLIIRAQEDWAIAGECWKLLRAS